ncbi:MAG: tetratricopeptide repeat protein, partial [Pyrinomonadaceae bacterium]
CQDIMSKSGNFTLLIVSISLALGAQQAPAHAQNQASDIERVFERAVRLHQAGDLEAAVREYQSFLASQPQNIEALSNLGAVYARLGRHQEAIDQYKKALGVDARNAAVRFNLAVAFYKSAMIAEAAQELARVVAAQPQNTNAVLLLADCHLRMGENGKVISALAPLETNLPDHRALAYLLGSALIRDQRVNEGQRMIDRILRDGESAEAHLLLGTAQLLARDFAGAIKDFARAVELDPKLVSANAYYGKALLESGNPTQAIIAFRKELEINAHDFESNLYIGVLLKQEQKNEEALKYFERALQIRPGAPDVRYQIGSALFASGKVAEAQQVLEAVLKEAPEFVEAHVTLATVYYRQKRKEDGDRHRAIVQKLNAEAQSRAPGAQDNLGPNYQGEGAPNSSTAPGVKPSQP